MLVLISDIKVRIHSAQSATHGICSTKLNGKEHLLPFRTRFIELFMHVTSAFNGSQVDVAAIKHAANWGTWGQARLVFMMPAGIKRLEHAPYEISTQHVFHKSNKHWLNPQLRVESEKHPGKCIWMFLVLQLGHLCTLRGRGGVFNQHVLALLTGLCKSRAGLWQSISPDSCLGKSWNRWQIHFQSWEQSNRTSAKQVHRKQILPLLGMSSVSSSAPSHYCSLAIWSVADRRQITVYESN